jgi:hypothetical protein
MFTENRAVFLRDFGVACVANGRSFTGLLDTPDETMNMAGVNVMSTMYQCTVDSAAAQAAGLASGNNVTVNGQPYVIRDVVLIDDGAFTNLTLSKVTP